MASLYHASNEFLARLGRTRFFSTKWVLYCSAFSGVIGGLMFLFGLVAAHNVGPMKPYWDEDQTAHFWRSHLPGAQAGASLLMLSGMFYLPFSSAIWWQMRRIPGLHPIVPAIQLSSAAAGVWTLSGPGVILGALVFRLERDPQITQIFTDFFWIITFAPWPTFMTQGFAWSYAVLTDPRPNPSLPKVQALVNFIVPICFSPAIAMHTAKHGPIAWNGALSYWVPGAAFVIQMITDAICLMYAIRAELATGEVFEDPLADTLEYRERQERKFNSSNGGSPIGARGEVEP